MTITRSSTGKQLYKDFSEYADQAAYNAAFGADQYALTLDTSNDYVYSSNTGGVHGGIYSGAKYQNLYLRSRAKMTGGGGDDWLALGLRRALSSGVWSNASNNMYFVLMRHNKNMCLIKIISGSASGISNDIASGVDPTSAEFDLVLIANGTALEALINGASKVTATDNAISAAGYVEIFKNQNAPCYFTDICVCSSPDIICSDLPSGYKFRVTDRDGNTKVATESSGMATVAGKTLMYPGNKVEVLDGSDVVVETRNLSDDVWGGDAFSYSATALGRKFVQLI